MIVWQVQNLKAVLYKLGVYKPTTHMEKLSMAWLTFQPTISINEAIARVKAKNVLQQDTDKV